MNWVGTGRGVISAGLDPSDDSCLGTMGTEWLNVSLSGVGSTGSGETYIGVTPGKTYNLGIIMGVNNCYGYFSYSQSINNHAVEIEAY